MEPAPAYARIVAWGLASQQQNKRLIGQPYLKFGQCVGIWGFLFELGGLLGAAHASHLDAFGHVFLGYQGPPGAIQNFFTEVATKQTALYNVTDWMIFFRYVERELLIRVGYHGEFGDYFASHGTDKIPLPTATEVAWQFDQQGSAIGAMSPKLIRGMFDSTYTPTNPETWEAARAAGLDIPATQN